MQQETELRRPWVLFVCLGLMGFALESPMFCVPPIMHIITEEFLLTHAQAGLIYSVPIIILAAVAIPGGTLADRIGSRKAAGIGVIVIVVGSLLRGTSTSFVTLLAFTCLYGVGLGLVFPNLLKLVGTWFPREKIGLATGIYTGGIIFGIALALAITLPVVLPITNSFQGVFYIWTIPAVAAAVMWWIVVKDLPGRSGQSKQISEGGGSSYRIWTNSTLWLVAVLLFIFNFTLFTWLGWTPQLMIAKGASPALAALMTSFISWLSLILNLVVPWVSDKIALRRLFIWPSCILLLLASLSAVYVPLPLGWAIAGAVGIAGGVGFPMLLVLPLELVPPEGIGRASGMVLSIGYIGGLVGPWTAGYILDITGSLNLNLIALTGLAAVGAYLALRLPETGIRAGL